MNILYHHRTQGIGAEGVHISCVINEFLKLGHKVNVVCPAGLSASNVVQESKAKKQKSGIKTRFFSFIGSHLPQIIFELLEMAYSAISHRRIKSYIQHNSVDMMYERYAFFMTSGAKISDRYSMPLILEVNEIVGHKRVRKQILTKIAQKKERYVLNKASAIIVVSQFLKNQIVSLGIDPDKIYVIPNGVDEIFFDPHKYDSKATRKHYGVEPESLVIGFVGSFVGWHNLQLLIKSFSVIVEEANLSLWLVGQGAQKNYLQNLCLQLGVADKVNWTGQVPHNEVPAIINAFDLCVIPGANDYRSPIKLFEYMAMGKCVLAPDYEPIRSVIKHEYNGFVFQPSKKEDMAIWLNRLIRNKNLRDLTGKNARDTILEKYLWRYNAEKVVDIYNSIVTA